LTDYYGLIIKINGAIGRNNLCNQAGGG